jgi:hypothetical protein
MPKWQGRNLLKLVFLLLLTKTFLEASFIPESEIPLLKGNPITIAANDLDKYKELIRIQADPNRIIYIRDIDIEIDDTTSLPRFKVSINGTPYLKDFPLLTTVASLGFGGDLRGSDTKDPLIIWVKKTAAGTGALRVACVVTGTQVPRGK